MDAEKLTTALFEKMKAEQDSYREWLVAQPRRKFLTTPTKMYVVKGNFKIPNTT